MYKTFFGLQENPFNVTPDPRFLYSTPHTQEALACLTYCVQARKGFVMLTGDVGTGKTTLLNKFLEWLREEQIASAFVFNPRLNPFQFLDYAMSDFGVNVESRLKSVILTELNNWLLARHQAGTTAVLIVDEAQDASPELLEEIRLLTNLETPSGKLLQIVLAGQQELEIKLRLPEFRQLRQRITLRAKTHPLTLQETHEYIATRLRIAGSDGRQVFSKEAVDAIRKYSEGIPRIINILCEDSLLSAFADHKTIVPQEIVEEVARELELDLYPATAPPPPELKIDDLVQPGVYVNRAKPAPLPIEPVVVEPLEVPEEPPAATPPVAPQRQELKPARTAAPAPPAPEPAVAPLPAPDWVQPISLPSQSLFQRRPAPRPVEPTPEPSVEETAIWSPAAEPPPTEVKADSVALVRTKPPAAGTPHRASDRATVAPQGNAPSDDEILQELRGKEPPKSAAIAPVAKVAPSAPVPAPRPAAPAQPFVLPTPASSQSRALWLAIVGALLVGAIGAFLIWKHTGQNVAPSQPVSPAPPVAATTPSPQPVPPPSTVAEAAPVTPATETQPVVATPPPPAAKTETPVAPPAPKPEDTPSPRTRHTSARTETKKTTEAAPAPPEGAPSKYGKGVVTSAIEGASITVDGKTSPGWVTPYVFPELSVGVHTIVVSKPGYEDAATRMTIREGETSYFRANIAASTGEISIVTEPPGLPVSFDGGPFQPSPLQVTLGAGPHKYQIKLPNSRIYVGSVDIRPGSIISRRVDFTGGEWLAPEK